MQIINNENHQNLKSNVPFESLPKWFQKTKTENAIVKLIDSNFIWECGTWKNGVWKLGTWKDGLWMKGVWLNGTWEKGVWLDGIWYNGIWYDGKCEEGFWHGGTWKNGFWRKGLWYDGIWEDGIWMDGTWYRGTWLGGLEYNFRCKHKIGINCKTNQIKIGCKIKTIKEWDKWFAGKETYETERNTEEFKLIYENYLKAKKLCTQ